MTDRQIVTFVGPRQAEVLRETLPAPGQGEMLIKTSYSAISSGTEMLVYRGQLPSGLAMDANFPLLQGEFHFPICYGYAVVGSVKEIGEDIPKSWLERQVFSFQPHATHFLGTPETVFLVPPGTPLEAACLLPNMETAVNLVQDGAPLLGENVIVFGQGMVGLLTTAILMQFPLHSLVTVDPYPCRRSASLDLGVTACLDPTVPDFRDHLRALFPDGADLSYELSGAPAALNDAIAATRFSGRVVIGSWYGNKSVSLDLGGSFHRSRIRLISSQVSSLAPELTGRWNKNRRFELAWQALKTIQPEKWVTQRFQHANAAEAYQLLDTSPSETIQVILEY
jgi:2-desacetyl-2-hydroxyethyl bacteriochlorophyllide A dehydrogenase